MIEALGQGRKTATRRTNRRWLEMKSGDVLLAHEGRYGKTEFSLTLTRDAYIHPLSEMGWQDAIKEGMKDPRRASYRTDRETGPLAKFLALWNEITAGKPFELYSNPVVLEFTVERAASKDGDRRAHPKENV
jgi:hypothetical protein